MITKELLQQAIKETAEGMLSGDPNYACKCVQTRDGRRARVFQVTQSIYPVLVSCEPKWGSAEWRTLDGSDIGPNLPHKNDLIPVPRKLKCWVRWYKTPLGNIIPTMIYGDPIRWEPSAYWITDPIEVVAEEKEQQK